MDDDEVNLFWDDDEMMNALALVVARWGTLVVG